MLSPYADKKTGPILAASLRYDHPESRMQTLIDHGLCIEYTPHEKEFPYLKKQISPMLQSGAKVRFHGFFPRFDIGDSNPLRAAQALEVHRQCLDAVAGSKEPYITFHTGLNLDLNLDYAVLLKNLAFLTAYGREQGICVQIENLKAGLTSDPDVLWNLAEKADAKITLDLGHALSCQAVSSGEWCMTDIIDLFKPRLSEVHFYEKELDRHYAPKDLEILGPVIDQLLLTDCQWWTIELQDDQELVDTADMVRNYLTYVKSEFRNLSN